MLCVHFKSSRCARIQDVPIYTNRFYKNLVFLCKCWISSFFLHPLFFDDVLGVYFVEIIYKSLEKFSETGPYLLARPDADAALMPRSVQYTPMCVHIRMYITTVYDSCNVCKNELYDFCGVHQPPRVRVSAVRSV